MWRQFIMLISVIILKLETTDKLIEFDDVLLKTMKTRNCHFLGNRIKYIAEIWYVEAIRNADFYYYIEIGN